MLRVTLKGLLAHKVRFVLTALAVVIGVSFVAGSFILTDSIDDAFAGLFEETSAGTDLYVRPAATVGDDVTQSWVSGREPLPAELAHTVAEVEGVAVATGWVEGFAQIVGPDGEPVGGQGPPVLGFSWSGSGPLELRLGREPRVAGEVVIDAVTAETTGYELGDEVPVITVSGAEWFLLVGVAGFGQSDNLLGASIAAFELEEARRLFDKPDRFDQIAIRAQPGVAVEDLRERVQDAVAEGIEVVTAQTSNEEGLQDIRGFLTILNSALLSFAFVAMFVGAFIIANTFSIVVAQRTREFALLRAVGASAKQVKRAVRGEALIVGLLASSIGLVLGVGFARGLTSLLGAFGLGIPTGGTILAPRTIVWSFVVGIGVTLVASYLPARRAAGVAPVEAMRGAATGDERGLGRRTSVGGAILLAGLAAFGLGAFGGVANAALWVGLGALVIMLGVATLSPALARPIAHVVGGLPARFGTAGKLARGNAARDRRRTAVTASALMIGLALVTFATIFAASATQSAAASIDEQFTADLSVATNQPAIIGLPPTIGDDLEHRDQFATVSRVRLSTLLVGQRTTGIAGVEPAEITEVVGLGELTGDPAMLGGPTVFVHRELFEGEGWQIGQTIPVAFTRTGEQRLRIIGTYENPEILGAAVMTSLDTFAEHVVNPQDSFLFLRLAPGVEAEEARAVLDDVLAAYPNVEVYDGADLRQVIEDGVNQVLGLMTVLLALAILVALLGITNTLALAVFERTREIGLLRAVGMTRRQVRAMVRWESSIVAVFGAVMGVAVGTLFGWALVRSLEDEGFSSLVIPGGRLVVYVVAAALAGVVAAAFPARRAAKLDVLEAVTVE
ncbi:MAG TPA: FtsX-like permease family protein [Nitriliruptorales bacterium]